MTNRSDVRSHAGEENGEEQNAVSAACAARPMRRRRAWEDTIGEDMEGFIGRVEDTPNRHVPAQ